MMQFHSLASRWCCSLPTEHSEACMSSLWSSKTPKSSSNMMSHVKHNAYKNLMCNPLRWLSVSFQRLRSCWLIITMLFWDEPSALREREGEREGERDALGLHQQAVTGPQAWLKREDQQVSWCQQRATSSTDHGFIGAWCNQEMVDQSQNKGCDT